MKNIIELLIQDSELSMENVNTNVYFGDKQQVTRNLCDSIVENMKTVVTYKNAISYDDAFQQSIRVIDRHLVYYEDNVMEDQKHDITQMEFLLDALIETLVANQIIEPRV